MVKKMKPLQHGKMGNTRKWEIYKSVFSILGFLTVFFALISGIVGFSLLLIFFSINIIFKYYFLYTIPFVLIFAVVAIMQLVFVTNFIFKHPQKSTSNLYEIDANNFPKLLAFIKSVAIESKIMFPKKIFLIPDANAFIFYETRFWHLFFPPQKNLCIGLGLLNVLNQSELKCILAHEFGHFKQNSIKIEGFVNRANQVIYKLLFGQERLDKLRNILPKVFPTFIYYMEYGNFLISIMEDILKWLFIKINTHHSSLQRSLEYDADHFSASVYGSENMIQTLTMRRYANYALSDLEWFFGTSPNLSTQNIYTLQNQLFNKYVYESLSTEDMVALEHSLYFRRNSPYSGIKIKESFESYPSLIDRITILKEQDHPIKRKEDAKAIELLSEDNGIFEIFTEEFFEELEISVPQTKISLEEFLGYYQEKQNSLNIGEPFGRFYAIYSPDFEFPDSNLLCHNVLEIKELFSEENQKKAFGLAILKEDLEILKDIDRGDLLTDFFEYDGLRYYKDQAKELEKEIKLNIKKQRMNYPKLTKKCLDFSGSLRLIRGKAFSFQK
jgi:Zn-dependent protease with chaperone function